MTLAAAGPHDNATLHRRKPSKELVGFRAEFLAAQLMRWKRLATGLITPGGGPHCIGHLGANVRFGSLADIKTHSSHVRFAPKSRHSSAH